MIVKALAPMRIGLFGGGTDLPEYANLYGGLTITFSINLRQHLTVYTDDNLFTHIGKNTLPYKGKLDFIHAYFSAYDLGSFHDVRFTSESEGLLESGLGASGAAGVALMGAIDRIKKLGLTKGELAEKARDIEIGLGYYGGRQDQYASVFGGFNAIIYSARKVEVNPLDVTMIRKLYPSMVLIHTGIHRVNKKIQEGFKDLSTEQIEKLNALRELAQEALEPLNRGDIEKVGHLLDQSWQLKKASNKGVSSLQIDNLYKKAKELGAWGGKTLGAGGGGYMFFIVDPIKKEEFIKLIQSETISVADFSLDFNGLEVRVL